MQNDKRFWTNFSRLVSAPLIMMKYFAISLLAALFSMNCFAGSLCSDDNVQIITAKIVKEQILGQVGIYDPQLLLALLEKMNMPNNELKQQADQINQQGGGLISTQGMTISLDMIRAQHIDKETGRHGCAAQAVVKEFMVMGKKSERTLDITYTVELLDKNGEFYVTLTEMSEF